MVKRDSRSRIGHSGGLFTGLDKKEIGTILASASTRTFKPSKVIITAGQPARHLFLLNTGNVNYHRLTHEGREIVLGWLTPKDVFGLGTLLADPVEYIGTAQAVGATEVFVWPHATIRRLSRTYPQLAENALRIVMCYLKSYADRHVGVVSRTAEQRTADTLIRLGCRVGQVLPHGVEVDMKNEHLASLADVSFFTISRILKAWERTGAVKKSRGKVLIRHPEKLLTANG